MKIEISNEYAKLDIDMIFNFLNVEARWCKGIPRVTLEKALKNSLCFGAFFNGQQIGFARIVTDYATFGNLVDVFVLPQYRKLCVSKQIMLAVADHPELQGLRRIMLATSDKQTMYTKYGYKSLGRPEIFMELFDADVYL